MPDVTITGYPSNLVARTVKIASGASVSEMIATQGMALIGIFTPTNGWTAAAIGFRACLSGNAADLVTAYDNQHNFEQSLVSTDAAAASVFIAVPQSSITFVPWLQLTSRIAASDTGVNQAAGRTLTLLFRTFST